MFRRRRLLKALIGLWCVVGAYAWWTYRGPMSPREIFRGVTYSCQRLPDEGEGGGLFHLVQVDLSAPGVSVYTTPLDKDAVAHGREYRLKYVSSAVRDAGLAAGVNGTIFGSDSGYFRRQGDLAKGVETVVSDHVVDHVCPYCWLLWIDDDMTPHLGKEMPPGKQTLARARWGIGTQSRILLDGQAMPCGRDGVGDQRTVLAINPQKKLLWLACFDKASFRYAGRVMRDVGATDAICLDGGTSTSMAIGAHADGVWSGSLIGGWRPVANCFGVRADVIK
jgi:hypothetical protein